MLNHVNCIDSNLQNVNMELYVCFYCQSSGMASLFSKGTSKDMTQLGMETTESASIRVKFGSGLVKFRGSMKFKLLTQVELHEFHV